MTSALSFQTKPSSGIPRGMGPQTQAPAPSTCEIVSSWRAEHTPMALSLRVGAATLHTARRALWEGLLSTGLLAGQWALSKRVE